ncbi:MAG: polymorphic toxin-type HINT domain-containing protein [Capsulimonadales bacterium]|nr:polymorphic toxin-type HINT domain-containing protein [Capsulimonadales bacterium]
MFQTVAAASAGVVFQRLTRSAAVLGKATVRTVTRTFKRTAYELVKGEFADATTGKVVETIKGTPEHPFFVEGGGMVAMGQLGIGTKVLVRAGPALVVKSITRESHPEGVAVYNFEVEGDHTYFVGKANGGIWVHNQCGYDLVLGTNKGNVLTNSWNRFMQEFKLAGGARSGLGIPRRTSVNILNDPAGFAAEAQGAKRILFNTKNIGTDTPITEAEMNYLLNNRQLWDKVHIFDF